MELQLLVSLLFIVVTLLGFATGELKTYIITNQTVGNINNEQTCLFFGPIDDGHNLTVQITATPGREVGVGVSAKRRCPPVDVINCGDVETETDDDGILNFQEPCNVAEGSWVILYTIYPSQQSVVSGEITMQQMQPPLEAYSFRNEGLMRRNCMFIGPVGEQNALHVQLWSLEGKDVALRVTEERRCPPQEVIWCGPNKFPVTRNGELVIHANCDIPAGAWIIIFMVDKTESTHITGIITFDRIRQDWNTPLIIGGISVLVAFFGLIGCCLCLYSRWKKNQMAQAADENVEDVLVSGPMDKDSQAPDDDTPSERVPRSPMPPSRPTAPRQPSGPMRSQGGPRAASAPRRQRPPAAPVRYEPDPRQYPRGQRRAPSAPVRPQQNGRPPSPTKYRVGPKQYFGPR